jgi:hypothetical protein
MDSERQNLMPKHFWMVIMTLMKMRKHSLKEINFR